MKTPPDLKPQVSMKFFKRILPAVFVFVVGLSLSAPVLAAPGDLVTNFIPVDTYGHIARFSSLGGVETGFPSGTGFNGPVNAVVRQTDGKFVVGGDFTAFNGIARNRIARLNSDGTLDTSFDPGLGFNGVVNAIAVGYSSTDIYVGGRFTEFNRVTRQKIARLNTDGSLDTAFAPSTGFQEDTSTVYALHFDSFRDTLYAGGSFLDFNQTRRKNIVRILNDGRLDTGFVPAEPNGAVRALAFESVIGDDLYIGGDFTSVGGIGYVGAARLNYTGALDGDYAPVFGGFNAPVRALQIAYNDSRTDHDVYVGGDFTYYGGSQKSHLARINSDGTADNSFDTLTNTFNGPVRAISLSATDGDLYAAGDFTSYAGVPSARIARINSNGTKDSEFDVVPGAGGVDGVLNAVVIDDTRVVAAGHFVSLQNQGFNGQVESILRQPDGKFIVAGSFTQFYSTPRKLIARLNADGTLDTTFNPDTALAGTRISAMAVDADTSDIYIGGDISYFDGGGISHSNIIRLNSDGSIDEEFGTSLLLNSSVITSIVVNSAASRLYVGGNFTLPQTGLVVLRTTDGTVDTEFHRVPGGFDNTVKDIELDEDGRLYVLGNFGSYRGSTITRKLARLNTDGTPDSTFTPTSIGSSTDQLTSLLYTSVNGNPKIYVSGLSGHVSRLNATDGSFDSEFVFDHDINSAVSALAKDPAAPGVLYLGGDFTSFNGLTRSGIVRLYESGQLDTSFGENGVFGSIGSDWTVTAIAANNNELIVGGGFTAYQNVARGIMAKLEASPAQPNFTVTQTSGSTAVSESGTTDTFTVFLHAAPVSNVVVNVNSSDNGEATVSPAILTFTPSNWYSPQTVTVTGVDDAFIDGSQTATVRVSIDTASSSSEYDAVVSQTLDVGVADNETPTTGIHVSLTDGSTVVFEAGATDTFTVTLGSAPVSGSVFLDVYTNNSNEASASPSMLEFTSTNWNIPQTVTVTGIQDFVEDGIQTVLLGLSPRPDSSAEYARLPPREVAVLVYNTAYTPSLVVVETDGSTLLQEGLSDTIEVSLGVEPAGDVQIAVVSGDTNEVQLIPARLSFTPTNWNRPQVVTLLAQTDRTVDGDKLVPITLSVLDGTSWVGYHTALDQTVISTVQDIDRSPGFNVANADGRILTLVEGAALDLRITLDSQPLNDVVFSVSTDAMRLDAPPQVAASSSTWDTPIDIHVSAVENYRSEGMLSSVVTISIVDALSSPEYASVPDQQLTFTIIDNDTAGFELFPASTIEFTEGTSSIRSQLQLKLKSQPLSNVVIRAVSSDTTEAVVAPEALVFGPANWDVLQNVIVSRVDDTDPDGTQHGTITFSIDRPSSDDLFDDLADQTISFIVADNEVAPVGLVINQSSGFTEVAENGGTDTVTVMLAGQPLADVVLTITSSNTGTATVDPATIVFTPSNWNVPQAITVVGVDDAVVDGDQDVIVSAVVDSALSSSEYATASSEFIVRVLDNDFVIPGFTISESSGSTSVTEDGTNDDFDVVLQAQPVSNVTLNVNSSDASEAVASVSSLTFTPSNWNLPQTVTVTGVDDVLFDGAQTATITVSVDPGSSDEYDAVASQVVAVSVTDNDVVVTYDMTLVESSGSTTVSESGLTDDFTVVLTAAPTSDVVVTVISADDTQAVVAPSTLTFTPSNWNTPQTVTVTGVNNHVVDGARSILITVAVDSAVSAPGYVGTVGSLLATVTDNETPGLTLITIGSVDVSETGTNAYFDVVLNTEPTSDVVLTVLSADTGEAVVSPVTLTFTSFNWNTPQTVAVTGVDDSDIDGTQSVSIVIAVDASVSSDEYDSALSVSLVASVTDDDVAPPGFTFDATTLSVSEVGTSDVFTVVLNSPPLIDVVLNINSNDAGEVVPSAASLIFTSSNWHVPQTVTVTGVDDASLDGTQIATITVSVDDSASYDPYDSVADQTISVSVADNEVALPSIIVTESAGTTSVSESGTHDKIVVVLTSAPTSDVVLSVVSNDTGEATITPATITFTPANWNVGQEVEVTGVDDSSVDGTQTVTVTIAVDDPASSDEYDAVVDQSVSVSVTDNDVASSSGGGGGGGGGGGAPAPAITLTTPNGGEVLSAGNSKLVLWSYQGSSNHTVRLDLSTDGGTTYDETVVASAPGTGSYLWTIPDKTAISAKLRAQLLYFGSPVATDASDAVFTLIGSDAGDLPRSGSGTGTAPIFIPSASINEDKGIVASASPAPCVSESLIRTASQSAVYYCGANGKRYVFPNEKIYFSWYADFSAVTVVSDEKMASIQIGGNVTYKPGSRMIKVESDPKTYVVSRGGQLRHVTTEAVAVSLYGATWSTKIDDLPVGFFTDYTIIAPITSADLP